MTYDSYGSEDEFIGKPKDGGSAHGMANGNGRVNWEIIRIVAQYLIYPIAAALVYLVLQNSAFDRRLSIIEITTSRPIVDVESIRKIAIIEDRQNRNTEALFNLKNDVEKHRDLSTYDPQGKRR